MTDSCPPCYIFNLPVLFSIRQRFVAQMAHSYSYGKKAEAPYATAVFTSYDFTRQKQRAIKAQQRALTLHLKELKTRDEVMAKRLASRQVRAGQGCLDM